MTEKRRLVDALKGIRAVSDPDRRREVLRDLSLNHGSSFAPSANADVPSVLEILNKCIELDAVYYLIDTLDMMIDDEADDDSERERLDHFRALVAEWLPQSMLRPAQRERMNRLVQGVPVEAARSALLDPALAGFVRFPVDEVVDAADACRRLEELGIGEWSGPPPLLTLLGLLAHATGGQPGMHLHQLVGQLQSELGLSDDTLAAVPELEGSKSVESPTADAITGEYTSDPSEGSHDDDSLAAGDDVRTNTTPVRRSPSQGEQPRYWGGVPPRNPNFVGRDEMIEDIRARLQETDRPATVLQNALYGLGGVGKTQLALEYAYRHQADYRLVWWIPADDEFSVVRSLVSLARRLGLQSRVDATENVELALEALRTDPQFGRWLLVFDNAEDPDVIRNYLPSGSGDVLITSRSHLWEAEMSAIEVSVFSPDESTQLLTERWKGVSEDGALRLADELGHLPLALVQAAAFHTQTAMPLEQYLGELRENLSKVMAEGNAPGYKASVAAMVRLGYDKLAERSPAAAQLLTVLTFISSHEIAISMLSRAKQARVPEPLDEVLRDDLQLRRAVGDLGRFALAHIDSDRDFISVHRLVRELIRGAFDPQERERYTETAHSVLAAANPGEPDRAPNWPHLAQIAPHIGPSDIIYTADAGARQVVIDQIRYLYDIGQNEASRSLGREAVDAWRGSLGADDVMTLVAARHLANAMRAVGAYDEARELDRDTLELMRASDKLGPDHPHTLAAAQNFAADLRLQGAFEQALALDETTWQQQREILGDNDPATARAANNVAVDCRLLGRFVRARQIDEDNVNRRAQIFRPDHPETLFSYRMLARDLYGLGLYQEALDLQREKLTIYEAVFEENKVGRDHVDLLYARRNMAILLRKVGDRAGAYEFASRLYDVHWQTFGGRHEHTLAAMVTLCNTLRDMGVDPTLAANRDASLERAQELGQEALATYREVLGADHPFTLACATDLAIVLRTMNVLDEAADLDERTYVALEQVVGPDHPYSLCSASNMTNNLALAGRPAEALELSREVLARSRSARVADHPLTLACAANHAVDLREAGHAGEAAALYNETRRRYTERLGPNHPDVISMERGLRAECDIEPPEM
jgi:tetratricopeptide (TPR) repeat protein